MVKDAILHANSVFMTAGIYVRIRAWIDGLTVHTVALVTSATDTSRPWPNIGRDAVGRSVARIIAGIGRVNRLVTVHAAIP